VNGFRALPSPCLMLVTDRSLAADTGALVRDITAAVDGGVNAVQVREKDLSYYALLELVQRVRGAIGDRALLLVNDNSDVATAAGADGVHGGEASSPVRSGSKALHGRMLIGRSVHSLAGAREAAKAGADYLVLGTIFASRSHPGGETGGVDRVREVTAAVNLPVIAIGGITVDNAPAVMYAGAAGVAVISGILGSADPSAAAAALWSAIPAVHTVSSAEWRTAVRG